MRFKHQKSTCNPFNKQQLAKIMKTNVTQRDKLNYNTIILPLSTESNRQNRELIKKQHMTMIFSSQSQS